MKTKEIYKADRSRWLVRGKAKRQSPAIQTFREEGLVTIPVHRLSNDLTPGLEKSILKQAQSGKK